MLLLLLQDDDDDNDDAAVETFVSLIYITKLYSDAHYK